MSWTSINSGPVVVLSEEAVGSNKVLQASSLPPFVTELQIDGIRVELTTTATVGNRTISIQLLDASDNDVLLNMTMATGDNVAASSSMVFEFIPGDTTTGSVTLATGNKYIFMPRISTCVGLAVKVFDSAAIDASGDTLIVHIRGSSI